MVSVRSWPVYRLALPPALRSAISAEARELDLSLAETVRRILCSRYRMECEPVTLAIGGSVGYHAERDLGHPVLLLRLPPALYRRVQAHSRRFTRNPRTVRRLILDALEEHYNT